MEIKRILNLSDDEFDTLIKAGELLGNLRDSKNNNNYDSLSEGANNLLKGLQEVLNCVVELWGYYEKKINKNSVI